MAFAVSTRTDLSELDEFAGRLNGVWESLGRDTGLATRAANLAGDELVGQIREAILSGPAPSRFFSVRTGALARSFRKRVRVTRRSINIAAVSDLVYARIQDKGGIILPRTVKRLAIPLTSWASKRWPRDVPRGTLFRRGNALSRRVGRRKIVNEYALAKQVRLKGKDYSGTAMEKAAPIIAQIFIEELIMKGLRDGV